MLAHESAWMKQRARALALQEKLAAGRWVLLLWVVYFGIFTVMLPWAAAQVGGEGPLDLKLFYSAADAYRILESYGPEGRAFYTVFELTGDIIYPIVYTLAFSLLASFLFRKLFPPTSPLQRLPLCVYPVWLMDLLENLGLVVLLNSYPAQAPGLVIVVQIFTALKFLFLLYALGLILVGLVGLAWRGIFGRRRTAPTS